MERIGFVGLPNAGKSSLFNAIGGQALAAAYPFATVDPNVAIAVVPDDRLDKLAEMSGMKSVDRRTSPRILSLVSIKVADHSSKEASAKASTTLRIVSSTVPETTAITARAERKARITDRLIVVKN